MVEVILEGLKKVPSDSCIGCIFFTANAKVCRFIKCDEDNEGYILVEE